jgi:signal transduction histidine kinase
LVVEGIDVMVAIQEKIEIIQAWMSNVQLTYAQEAEPLINRILDIIQPGISPDKVSKDDVTEVAAELARQVQEQMAILRNANNAIKHELQDHEQAEIRLRKAHNNLEEQLQNHIKDLSRLNEVLQVQIMEQKRSQAVEREERALTDALRDTLTTMSRTLDLGKVLDQILDNVSRITPYDGANVLLVESDLIRVVRQRGYLEKGQDKEGLALALPAMKLATLQQLMDSGKALAIPDTTSSPLWIGFPNLDWVNSNVIAPIRANGRILGFLSLDSATRGYFTQAHAERLQSFADQAAIAIQNARLLERAKRAAVLAERNRLANELHDTISQTLWSLILISERLPAIWKVNEQKGEASLAMLHQLAQSALEEMRALLLELRPSALEDENLGDLIRQVATIIVKRAGLQLSIKIEKQEPVPPEVQFVFYRVVQEALNNIAHHALAKNIEIYFNSDADEIELSIHDDGIGFEPDDVEVGHLGLSIMRDRIQAIGGTIEIISNEGTGTLIRLNWTNPKT